VGLCGVWLPPGLRHEGGTGGLRSSCQRCRGLSRAAQAAQAGGKRAEGKEEKGVVALSLSLSLLPKQTSTRARPSRRAGPKKKRNDREN
jgi:hypothetical protein